MSKVVFVGNVPYNMGEEQLIEVFKSVGQVVGFRLVFDRETGKAKGYGFCEFADHETALSAVRNLNNTDVGGRPLRIDLADSDPFLEGKSTVRGELRNSAASSVRGEESLSSISTFAPVPMANLPPGKPVPKGMTTLDAISQTLAAMPTGQCLEMLSQMKAFIISNPEHAKTLLQKHPQLSYALFQALVLNNIIPAEVILRMHGSSTVGPAPPVPPIPQNRPQVGGPPHMQHPPPFGMPPFPPGQTTSMPPPPPPAMGPPPSNAGYGGMPPYYRPPGPPAPVASAPPPVAAPAPPVIDDSQRDMLMTVLSMSQDAINALPEAQRQGIMQLRTQFMGMASQT